jgi:hypothetical protein
MKRRLGLDERDQVPAEIHEVENVARRLGRGWPRDEVAEGVMDSSELDGLLREAEYLAAKKKALQAAGFSSEEAMRILVADVGAGRSQRPDS